MQNKPSKKDLENIIYNIEHGYDLIEDDIKLFKNSDYIKKYEYKEENGKIHILMHLKKPILNETLFFYYQKGDTKKVEAVYYSRNP